MSDNRVADSLIAFGAGLLAGLAAGLLLAPKSGEETRRQLGEMAERTKHQLGDAAGRLGHRTAEEASKAKSFVTDQVHRVEHAIEEGKQAYRAGNPNKPS